MGKTIEERLKLLEDIQEITKLKGRYWKYANGGWDRPTHDYDRLADLWVEDGVFDGGPVGGGGEGREKFALISSKPSRSPSPSTMGPTPS